MPIRSPLRFKTNALSAVSPTYGWPFRPPVADEQTQSVPAFSSANTPSTVDSPFDLGSIQTSAFDDFDVAR